MRKILIVLISLILTGCSLNTNSIDFSKRMTNEEAKVSIILGVKYEEEMDFPVSTTWKITLSPNFINLDDNYVHGLHNEICTNDQIEIDTKVYFNKLNELIEEYSNLLSKLDTPSRDGKVNYNDLIVGFECLDDLHSTAYLYTNKIMKIKIEDKSEFYSLSDKEYNDIVIAYIDFTDSYLNNVDSCPCWNKDYNDFFKTTNTSE
jgi:uncharacterized protein YihD (DUF1040 family)